MPPRKGKVWSSGRRSVALSIVAAGLATLLSPALAANRESRNNRALEGLDLVEDLSTETIKSMKSDMVSSLSRVLPLEVGNWTWSEVSAGECNTDLLVLTW